MSYVYAEPPAKPDHEETQWVGMPCTWTGWDGSVWTLTDRTKGVYLRRGVRGLSMPSYTRHSSSSPAVRGSRHRGTSVLDREVFWPLSIFHGGGSAAWQELDTAFWRTMDPDREGTWTIQHPGGATRSIDLRFKEDEDTIESNPWRLGWQKYGITLLADSPLWRGALHVRRWKQSEDVSLYFPPPAVSFTIATDTVAATAHGLVADDAVLFENIVGTTGIVAGTTYYVAGTVTADTFQISATPGGAVVDMTGADGTGAMKYKGMPIVRINSGSTLDTATMSNPGDVSAYPVWTVVGPTTDVTVGVGGETINIPFPIPDATKAVQIDTDPVSGQVAWYGDWDEVTQTLSNKVDRTKELGAYAFVPIPSGADRELSLTMAGTGTVSAKLTELYRRGI